MPFDLKTAGTKMLMKAGYINVSVDNQYNTVHQRFKLVEAESLKLQKHVRGYSDTFGETVEIQEQMAEIMGSFGDSAVLEAYCDSLEKISAQVPGLKEVYKHSVYNPINRYNSSFGDVEDAMSRREAKQMQYDVLRAKVKRLQDKLAKDRYKNDAHLMEMLTRAQRKLDHAQHDYNELNDQLKTELPQLIDLRVQYLGSSFRAFVQVQIEFCAQMYCHLNKVQNCMDEGMRQAYANGELDKQLDDVLDRMGQMTIVH